MATNTVTGTGDGNVFRIPMTGFPPMVGTTAVIGPSVQMTLNWTFQLNEGGGLISVQLSATLNRQ